jgi:sarcosine oxidase subunit alpha
LAEGGDIDRSSPVQFQFDGQRLTGFEGDTLASALLANGVKIVGRSFKYHRPRGVLTCGVEEPNALVEVGGPAGKAVLAAATQIRLREGLVAKSVNSWPSARHDLLGLLDRLHRFLPAGFYYKTFKWPAWRLYEPAIRRLAGLGRLPDVADPEFCSKRHASVDVLVIGSGAAGLAAAAAAAKSGARTFLLEQEAELGGSLAGRDVEIDGRPARSWVRNVRAALDDLPNLTVLPNATAFGYYDHNFVAAVETVFDTPAGEAAANLPRRRLWKLRAREVVLATGAIERPLLFPGNDRPGVMLASAVQAHLRRFAVVPGRRVVVGTNNDTAYETAEALAEAGCSVTLVDVREEVDGSHVKQAEARGIAVLLGHQIIEACGSPVGAARVSAINGLGRARIECDLVCTSGGWNPTIHLYSQSGGKLLFDEATQSFGPGESRQKMRPAGSCAGIFSLEAALRSGSAAGAAAARDCGFRAGEESHSVSPPSSRYTCPPLRLPHSRRDRTWVDFQNDVTLADIALAARENFVSVEHLKRYTTLGMAVDQGKTSNVNGLMTLAAVTGRMPAEVGTTTFRPPYTPVPLAALAGLARGELFRPKRYLPLHGCHAEQGASFVEAGGWQRPELYPRAGETRDEAIRREVLAVRNGVGLFDASSLGKIEVSGPDAGIFLDRIYLNQARSLKAGRLRYGLRLSDAGIVADDGVIGRLEEERFWVSTTSGAASATAAELERLLQCEWPELRVFVTPVSNQWAVINAAGPHSRRLLERAGISIDISASALPHMSVARCTLAGREVRIFRVSFTGELSYEINVPASEAPALWGSLLEAGSEEGVCPFGLEAINILRMEKGYVIVGVDTDGTTTPGDIGMQPLVDRKISDFLGRRSLQLPFLAAPGRHQLVGLAGEEADVALPVGAALLSPDNGTEEGHITSSCFSPTLQTTIALAMLRAGRDWHGERMLIVGEGGTRSAQVVSPCFYDPEGCRLRD